MEIESHRVADSRLPCGIVTFTSPGAIGHGIFYSDTVAGVGEVKAEFGVFIRPAILNQNAIRIDKDKSPVVVVSGNVVEYQAGMDGARRRNGNIPRVILQVLECPVSARICNGETYTSPARILKERKTRAAINANDAFLQSGAPGCYGGETGRSVRSPIKIDRVARLHRRIKDGRTRGNGEGIGPTGAILGSGTGQAHVVIGCTGTRGAGNQ